jgi:RNase P subunit RPR2
MKKLKTLSKFEIFDKIKQTFANNPASEEIKKLKKLAMSKNIRLTEYKKLYCKRCYSLFKSSNSKIRIKKPYKIIKCKNCGFIGRYKLSQEK